MPDQQTNKGAAGSQREPPRYRKGFFPRLAQLTLLGIIAYVLYHIAPEGLENLNNVLREQGILGILRDPLTVLGLLAISGEILLGLSLAKVTLDIVEEEKDIISWVTFILTVIAIIIGEAITFATLPTGVGLIIILLAILASLIAIYLAVITKWPFAWTMARRWICSTIVPWHFKVFVWVMEKWVKCTEWGLYTSAKCLEWVVNSWRECAEWGINTTKKCVKWAEETSTTCRKWGTETSETCRSWLPIWLGFICTGWEVIVKTVCLAWETITTLVCIVWVIVEEIACLAWVTVTSIVCSLWAIATTMVCLAFAIIAVAICIGWVIVVFFVRIYYLC